jgi:endo-1,3-1,4-beta-glycanase ExoK
MQKSMKRLAAAGLLSFAAGAAPLLHVAPAWAKEWKGAELITQQTFRYGAFEARIRAARGSGLITPFFLWKNNSEVPGQEWQEQDFEIFGSDGRYQTQLMTPGEGGAQRKEHNIFRSLPEPAWSRYYTYRMEWTPEQLSFYVDGQLVRSETDSEEFDKLLNPDRAEAAQLRVSIWAGDGPWSGAFDEAAAPQAAFVNWVETYAYTPGSGPGGSDFSSLWRDDFDNPGSPDSSRWWPANWTFDAAVNDYVAQNASVKDGALVLVFTDTAGAGVLPDVPADDGSSGGGSADDGSDGDGSADDGSADDGGEPTGAGTSGDDEAGSELPQVCTELGTSYSAESMSASTGGASEDGWNLWSNGSLTASHTFAGESAVVSVRARGQFAAGAWPHLVVRIDDRSIGEAVVDSTSYADFEFTAAAAGTHDVSVWFDNDYYEGSEDRNLFVDTVTVAPICE